MTVTDWIRKNASTILTCIGAGGVVATVVLAIRATPKAMDKMIDVRISKGEGIPHDDGDDISLPELTASETIQCCWKEYIPTVAVGIGSLVCIFGANILDRRQQASMASAYAALTAAFEGYRDKAEMLCGPGTNAAIDKAIQQEKKDIEDDRPPWDETQTFYIEGQSQFFTSTMEKVIRAEYLLNRCFIGQGSVMLNDLFELLNIPKTEEGDYVGWDEYIGEAHYGYKWIDFYHRYYTTEDGMSVCAIDMPFGPHRLDEDD